MPISQSTCCVEQQQIIGPRQLMLGLIDDLPQERRGIRQLMMWGSLGLAVVLFFVLVWVTAPSSYR